MSRLLFREWRARAQPQHRFFFSLFDVHGELVFVVLEIDGAIGRPLNAPHLDFRVDEQQLVIVDSFQLLLEFVKVGGRKTFFDRSEERRVGKECRL